MKTSVCLFAAALLAASYVWAADSANDIDWNRARDLHQRWQRGERLASADQAYLDRAKAQRQQRPPSSRQGEPAPAAVAAVAQTGGTHREVAPLEVRFKRLNSICLHPNGNLLAADGGARELKEVTRDGKVVRTLAPGMAPEAVATAPDGTIYCGGGGKLVLFAADGKIVKTVSLPVAAVQVGAPDPRRARDHGEMVSGLVIAGPHIFAAIGAGWSVGSKSRLFRFDRELGQPTLIAQGLRGCCQRCDLAARDNTLFIAENAAHHVVRCDINGKVLATWGTRAREGLEGFGSCCNPMNLCFGSDGTLYTAESGLGRIKRYKPDGTFLNLVGYVDVERFNTAGSLAASCSNISFAVAPDGRRVFIMDYKNNLIRVLEQPAS